jgi:hypothetical protein
MIMVENTNYLQNGLNTVDTEPNRRKKELEALAVAVKQAYLQNYKTNDSDNTNNSEITIEESKHNWSPIDDLIKEQQEEELYDCDEQYEQEQQKQQQQQWHSQQKQLRQNGKRKILQDFKAESAINFRRCFLSHVTKTSFILQILYIPNYDTLGMTGNWHMISFRVKTDGKSSWISAINMTDGGIMVGQTGMIHLGKVEIGEDDLVKQFIERANELVPITTTAPHRRSQLQEEKEKNSLRNDKHQDSNDDTNGDELYSDIDDFDNKLATFLDADTSWLFIDRKKM